MGKKLAKIRSKTEKVNITIKFYIFEIFLVPNFSLNWQFWIFGQNQPKKGISDLQKKKGKITTKFNTFKLVLVLNFNFNKQYRFFETNFKKKRILPVKNRKIEHQHWIVHTQTSLRTKFQLKLTILSFQTILTQPSPKQKK